MSQTGAGNTPLDDEVLKRSVPVRWLMRTGVPYIIPRAVMLLSKNAAGLITTLAFAAKGRALLSHLKSNTLTVFQSLARS
jgi:hypothetical protein